MNSNNKTDKTDKSDDFEKKDPNSYYKTQREIIRQKQIKERNIARKKKIQEDKKKRFERKKKLIHFFQNIPSKTQNVMIKFVDPILTQESSKNFRISDFGRCRSSSMRAIC